MTREQLLKLIATAGYDVGLKAKTHFATFDVVEKGPSWLGAAAFVGGIYGASMPVFAAQTVSVIFAAFGVVSLYIGSYSTSVVRYAEAGKLLTVFFRELHLLYRTVASLPPGADVTQHVQSYEDIRSKAESAGISKQIYLSDAYGRYKFFRQMQIDWISEFRPFNFWRDKVPRLVYVFALTLLCLWVCRDL